MTPRLAIVATHPIQYYAPVFRRLAERGRVAPHVFYGWAGASGQAAHDHGFGQAVAWDIPLLEGYPATLVENTSRDPGTHHFRGIDTPDMVDQVLAYRPDAVLVYGWAWKGHLRALRRLRGRVPVLFRGDSTLLDERPGPRTMARRLLLRWVYRHVDRALYVGAHNRAYFRAHGLGDERLVWAPHSIDAARFVDASGDREGEARAWRRSLAIPDEALTFLFAGKLEPKKAPDVLLEAFASLDAPNAHLIFVGAGPLERDLRQRADAHAPGRVHFVGFQNQSRMPTAYRLGDVLVLPSRGPGETWGLAVNEAFACGRPAIVSDRVGCAPDLVVDGETGAVVSAGDPAALRLALARVAADLADARRMGRAARSRIADWSIERQVVAIEQAALDAARTPPAPAP